MSQSAFQKALCDLIASPQLCVAARLKPEEVFGNYVLTDRELQRLISVVNQRGMSTNCTLYRVNRITPIYTLLPNTSFLLGDELVRLAEKFWALERSDMQFKLEIEHFGDFLREQIDQHSIENEFVEEMLDFELAINSLRFLQRKNIENRFMQASGEFSAFMMQLHPLIRVVRFQHEPTVLLSCLSAAKYPGNDIPKGDYYLLIDATVGDLEIRKIESHLGMLLQKIESGELQYLPRDDFETLASASLILPANGAPIGYGG
jgi:hypothetical protein